ncbi:MAG: hypothetical protein ABSF72_11270 [Candidatus Sulfotelmatobacter sp.]|jgi:hypothetical protein
MKFPEELTIIVQDQETGRPVDKVAVRLAIVATRKSNYSVGPLITDEKGEVVFTRAHCEFAIRTARDMFLMDYQDNLEECRPFVEIELHRADRVTGMIRQYRAAPEFWGLAFRDPEVLVKALEGVRNAEYQPASITVTEEEFSTVPRIVLPVSRSKR